MKFLLALFLFTQALTAEAAIKGAPFMPEEDQRFDSLENQVTAAAGISRLYAKAVYDVAVQGGGSTSTHSLGVVLPAGAIIQNVFVYVNTVFTHTGLGSVALQCAGTADLMGNHDMALAPQDSYHSNSPAASNAMSAGAFFPAGGAADWTQINSGGSVPTACTVTAVVRTGTGNDMTAGKMTAIISYFIR